MQIFVDADACPVVGIELYDRIVDRNLLVRRINITANRLVDENSVKKEEGCLSLDGVRRTTRYQEIEVEYYDFNWKKQRQKLSGWTAQICQHEIDHLSGKII